jgi:hypothetical protein
MHGSRRRSPPLQSWRRGWGCCGGIDPPAKQAILDVLKVQPQASVAQIAVSAGVGRSTAGKLLAQLASDGEVHRTEGGRDGNRRQPDLWSLAGQQPAANEADAKPATDDKPSGDTSRLKPGELEPLVLAYLKENADSGPHGPTAVANALERSSGAVASCPARPRQAGKRGQRQAASLKPRSVTRDRCPALVRAKVSSPYWGEETRADRTRWLQDAHR